MLMGCIMRRKEPIVTGPATGCDSSFAYAPLRGWHGAAGKSHHQPSSLSSSSTAITTATALPFRVTTTGPSRLA